jgi:hypothetical protein
MGIDATIHLALFTPALIRGIWAWTPPPAFGPFPNGGTVLRMRREQKNISPITTAIIDLVHGRVGIISTQDYPIVAKI